MNVRVSFRVLASIGLAICCVCPPATAANKHSPQSIEQARERMVIDDVIGAGITNARVIQAMSVTPRHEFVPTKLS